MVEQGEMERAEQYLRLLLMRYINKGGDRNSLTPSARAELVREVISAKFRGSRRDTITTARGKLNEKLTKIFEQEYEKYRLRRKPGGETPENAHGDKKSIKRSAFGSLALPDRRKLAEFILASAKSATAARKAGRKFIPLNEKLRRYILKKHPNLIEFLPEYGKNAKFYLDAGFGFDKAKRDLEGRFRAEKHGRRAEISEWALNELFDGIEKMARHFEKEEIMKPGLEEIRKLPEYRAAREDLMEHYRRIPRKDVYHAASAKWHEIVGGYPSQLSISEQRMLWNLLVDGLERGAGDVSKTPEGKAIRKMLDHKAVSFEGKKHGLAAKGLHKKPGPPKPPRRK